MIRTFAFACAMAALSTSPTWAQSNTATSPQPAPTATPAAADKFVPSQSIDEWRAAKLVGVTVVGADNKKLGKISDVLIDHNGAAQVVVISAGGFLGVGGKMVGVPFKEMKWHTEGRTVEISTAPPANGGSSSSPAGGGSAGSGVATAKTDPAATEANQGYPDVAELDMTEAQLKQAPDFKYAPEPSPPAEFWTIDVHDDGPIGNAALPIVRCKKLRARASLAPPTASLPSGRRGSFLLCAPAAAAA